MDKTIRQNQPLPEFANFNFNTNEVKEFSYVKIIFYNNLELEVGQVVRLQGSNLVRINRFQVEEDGIHFVGAADNGPKLLNAEKIYSLDEIAEVYLRDPSYIPFAG